MADTGINEPKLTVKDNVSFANITVNNVEVASGKRQKAVISGDSESYLTGEDKTITVNVKVGNRNISKTVTVNRTRLVTTLNLGYLDPINKYTPYGEELDFGTDETPSYEGYIFSGWYTDSGYTQEYNTQKKITSNQTLYAKWIPAFTLDKLKDTLWVDDVIDNTVISVTDNLGSPYQIEWYADNPNIAFNAGSNLDFSLIKSGTVKINAKYGNLIQSLTFNVGATHTVSFYSKFAGRVADITARIHNNDTLGLAYTNFYNLINSGSHKDVHKVVYTLSGLVIDGTTTEVNADTVVTSDLFISAVWVDNTPPKEVPSLSVRVDTYKYDDESTITVTWSNPDDFDFKEVVVLADGAVVGTTSGNKVSFNKSISNGVSLIVRTRDNAGNESNGLSKNIEDIRISNVDTISIGKIPILGNIAAKLIPDGSIEEIDGVLCGTGIPNEDSILDYSDDDNGITYIKHISVEAPLVITKNGEPVNHIEFNATTKSNDISLDYRLAEDIVDSGTSISLLDNGNLIEPENNTGVYNTFRVQLPADGNNSLAVAMGDTTENGRNQTLSIPVVFTIDGRQRKIQIGLTVDVVFSREVYYFTVDRAYINTGSVALSFTGESSLEALGNVSLSMYIFDDNNATAKIAVSSIRSIQKTTYDLIKENESQSTLNITVYPTGFISLSNLESLSDWTSYDSSKNVTLEYITDADTSLIGLKKSYVFGDSMSFGSVISSAGEDILPKDYYANESDSSGNFLKKDGYRLTGWEIKANEIDFPNIHSLTEYLIGNEEAGYSSQLELLNGKVVTATPIFSPVLDIVSDYFINLDKTSTFSISANVLDGYDVLEGVIWSTSSSNLTIESDTSSNGCIIVPVSVGDATITAKVGNYIVNTNVHIYSLDIDAPDVIYDDGESSNIKAITSLGSVNWTVTDGGNN